MTAPTRRAWLVGAAVGLPLGALGLIGRSQRVLESLSDEALLVPLAQRLYHPDHFTGDEWLALGAEVFSHAYSALLGGVLQLVADPQLAVGLLGAAAMVVYVAGLARLLGALGDRRTVAVGLVALVGVPALFDPVFQAALGGPFAWETTRLAALSLGPGDGLPRDLVFALFPWLVVRLLEEPSPVLWRRLVPYALLGLVANLHPLTAVHLAVVAGFFELARERSVAALRFVVVSAAVFAVGAAPYVVQYLAAPRTEGTLDAAVAAWRVFGIHGETAGAWVARMEPLLLLGLVAGGALVAGLRGEVGRPARRTLVVGLLVLAVAAAAPLVAWVAEPLRAFQFQRLGRPAAVLLVVGSLAHLGSDSVRRDRRLRAALGAGVAYLLLVGVLAWLPGAASPLHRAVRRWERARGVEAVPPAPEGLIERDVAREPASSPTLSAAFEGLAAAVRAQVPPGSVVLVPPEHFGAFRGYARRGTSVTRKEGGFAVTFLGGEGMRWFEAYRDAVRTYASGDARAWAELAERHGAHHVVVEQGVPAPRHWDVLHEDAVYRLLRVR